MRLIPDSLRQRVGFRDDGWGWRARPSRLSEKVHDDQLGSN